MIRYKENTKRESNFSWKYLSDMIHGQRTMFIKSFESKIHASLNRIEQEKKAEQEFILTAFLVFIFFPRFTLSRFNNKLIH